LSVIALISDSLIAKKIQTTAPRSEKDRSQLKYVDCTTFALC